MSAPGPLSNGGAAQTVWGPLNIQSATLSSVLAKRSLRRRRRKTKHRKENSVVECQEMCKLEKPKKRKSSESLEEQGSEVRSSDNSDSRREAPSDNSLDSTQPVKAKRAKLTTHSVGTAKTSSLLSDSWEVDSGFSSETSPPTSGRSSPCIGNNPSMLVAVDCEMVGTGPNGHCSELARCSILNYSGTVIYDKYIMPRNPVTNYRTQWSGIKEEHLKQALPYEEARKEILHVLKGKIIIGHALHNDFKVLGIAVPRSRTRDTSSLCLLRQLYGTPQQCISLKKLAQNLLNRKIQVGRAGHCSVEDALAALDLYKLVEEEWEKSLQAHIQNSDFIPEPTASLEHYMQDQYWPESLTDCN
ncbi:apoptosis-enhancing nuclease [Colossoma macropomum]|uniref:apoptosis-enhancing nuclease n=1 Tax=Colossoma macropomum TaxID=42526 RepID=UPI001864B4E3|nr:apoptosis-enhancing nuclease [Colossoma macropomum]XP_036424294.1 apoptosis-enhancing nuclease [Colossoma macropomum]